MSYFAQDTKSTSFVDIKKELLYDGPGDQENRVFTAKHAGLDYLEFDVRTEPNLLLMGDVQLEI
jgi:hypothetical protein